jgi:hypothetical protein
MRHCPSCQSVARPRHCVVGQIKTMLSPIPHPQRGAARDRHGRWERDAMDAHRRAQFICATSGVCADGEVVWFWRSDAGAKSRGTCPARRRWQPSWSPGRSRISRKTIAQGRPDDPPVPVVLPRAFFLHADHGCGGHPAFPAPSSVARAKRKQKLGRHLRRGNDEVCRCHCGRCHYGRCAGEGQNQKSNPRSPSQQRFRLLRSRSP